MDYPHLYGTTKKKPAHTLYLEESFEHDVYDLVLLIDVVQLHQILERVQLIFPLGLKQSLVCYEGSSGGHAYTHTHTQTERLSKQMGITHKTTGP